MAISKIIYKANAQDTGTVWMDATPATAAAADILSPKTAMLADGVLTTGTGSGGGGSSWTLVASKETTQNVTSKTSVWLQSADISFDTSKITSSKLWYVKIRDKAGKRNGYFYGSDCFIWWADTTLGTTYAGRSCIYVDANGVTKSYTSASSTVYGIEGYGLYTEGRLQINGRYNSSYTGTIDGTYTIELYTLDYPDNTSPFD